MPDRAPNVLVIVSDHHHWRMAGYLDHPHVKTPALDALAADGAVFTQAYCNNPVCGPAVDARPPSESAPSEQDSLGVGRRPLPSEYGCSCAAIAPSLCPRLRAAAQATT